MMKSPLHSALFAAAAASTLALTGCSAVNITATSPLQSEGVALRGSLHGGSQPVAGSRIYLLAANQNGYPTASTNASASLLTSGVASDSVGFYVTSDSAGNFSITGDYTCTAGQQVYLLAMGGDPGTGSPNSNLTLASVLGNCPAIGNFLGAVPFINVNEVSTVAAAYALSGFAVDALHIGAPAAASLSAAHPTAAAGLANAFATFPLLADVSTGLARTNTGTTAGNGVVPTAEINTLADILSACVNSSNTSSGGASAACATLFSSATSNGLSTGVVPTDTFTAAINIAHNPAANISSLCGLQPAIGAPFQPTLSCATSSLPNDFTVSIQYPETNGSSLNDLAVDASGNIVVVGSGGIIARYDAASGYKETAQPLGASRTFKNVAISNGLIVASATTSTGVTDDGLAFLDTGFNSFAWRYTFNPDNTVVAPGGVAFSPDRSTLYVADTTSGAGGLLRYGITYGSSASSDLLTTLAESSSGFNQPVRVALDTAGNIYGSNLGGSVGKIAPDGTATGSYSMNFANGNTGLALDQTGYLWITSSVGGAAGQILTPASTSRYTSGTSGQYYPLSVAVDGSNRAWMSNTLRNGFQSLSAFNGTGVGLSPSNGFRTFINDATALRSVAIDGSGNVWAVSSSHLYQFVGAATPVVTPIVASLSAPYTTAAAKP